MYVNQQGMSFNIMQSVFTSSLSLLNSVRKIANQRRKVAGMPEAHIDLSDAVEGQQEGSATSAASETVSLTRCGVGWGSWRGCGGCGGRCSWLYGTGEQQTNNEQQRAEDGVVFTENPVKRKTTGDVEMATGAK